MQRTKEGPLGKRLRKNHNIRKKGQINRESLVKKGACGIAGATINAPNKSRENEDQNLQKKIRT